MPIRCLDPTLKSQNSAWSWRNWRKSFASNKNLLQRVISLEIIPARYWNVSKRNKCHLSIDFSPSPFLLSSNRKMNERCFDDILGEGKREEKRKGGYYSRELLKTNIILKNDGGEEDVETLNAKSSLSAIYIPPLSSHFSPSLRSSSLPETILLIEKKKKSDD